MCIRDRYIAAINDLEANDCSKAQHEFEQIKNLNPGFPYVQDYISQAADPSTCKQAFPSTLDYEIGGGVLVLIVVVVGVLAMTKKKPAHAVAGAPAYGGTVAIPGGAAGAQWTPPGSPNPSGGWTPPPPGTPPGGTYPGCLLYTSPASWTR